MRASLRVLVLSFSSVAAMYGDLAGVDAREQGDHLVVRLVADGAQQLGRLELALAIDLDVQLAARAGLELEPGAAVGDDLAR